MGNKHTDHILKTAPFGYAYHEIILDDQGNPQDYRFLDVNQAFEELTGLKRDHIIDKTILQIMPNIVHDPANWIQVYGAVAQNGETLTFEQYSQPLSKWYQVQAHCPEPGYFTTIFTDISFTKDAVEQLENFFQVNLDLLCIADLDGRFLKVNNAWEELLGYTKQSLEGSKFLDYVHPEDLDPTLVAMKDLAENKEVLDFTNRYRCQDGTYRYIQWRSKPKGHRIYAAARDVTQRILNEKRLEDRETRLRSLFNSLDDLVLVLDPQNRVIEYQPSHEQRLLVSPTLFLGKSFSDIPFPEPARSEILSKLELVRSTQHPQRLTYSLILPLSEPSIRPELEQEPNTIHNQKPDSGFEPGSKSTLRWYDALLSPMFLPTGEYIGITAVIRNITEMKNLTNELELKSQLLEEIITGTNAGTWQWQVQTGQVSFNDRWAHMIGYTLEELEPISIKTWETYTHPEDLVISAQKLEDHFTGKTEYYECEARMRHRDGHWVWVLDRGKVSHWSDDGKPLRMAGTHQDISQRKEFETQLIQAREDALLASKAKSTFLSVMSHEIRTPLNGVIGFSDLLLKTPLNGLQKAYVQNAKSSGVLLLEIINNILDFSKLEAGKLDFDYQQVDLLGLLKEVLHITQFSPQETYLERILWTDPSLPAIILADPLRLKQILVNLLSNAVKFTSSGEVELAVRLVHSNTQDQDQFLEFSVRDTGVGIEPQHLSRLFQPFSQADSSVTRRFGGTGLGLSITKILVEQMEGSISVESKPGVGTTFTVVLPFPKYLSMSSGSEGQIRIIDQCNPSDLTIQLTTTVGGEFTPLRFFLIEPNQRQREVIVDYLTILGALVIPLTGFEEELINPLGQQQFHGFIFGSNRKNPSFFQGCWDYLSEQNLDNIPGLILSPDGQGEIETPLGQRCPSLTYLVKPIGFDDLCSWVKEIRFGRNYQQSGTHQIKAQIEDGDSVTSTQRNEPISLNDPSRAEPAQSQWVMNPLPRDPLVILIADDVPMNVILFEAYLLKLYPGCKILAADNGNQVIEVLEGFFQETGHVPTFIFMDVQMPEMDGITATKHIRSSDNPRFSQVPIIALTAGASQSDEQACLLAGMNGFLTKPLTLHSLELFLKSFQGP
jgi:PAS domain S-box-containing protein